MKKFESTTRYRPDQAKNLVSFMVGGIRYAVDIQLVREIVNPLPSVCLPHAPAEVVGVSDHRGEVLPIVDLRIRFGNPRPETTRRTKWIIAQPSTHPYPVALVVDEVADVFGAGESDQRSVPELGRGEELRGISTVYSQHGQLVFVVDTTVVTSAIHQLDPRTLPPRLQEAP